MITYFYIQSIIESAKFWENISKPKEFQKETMAGTSDDISAIS